LPLHPLFLEQRMRRQRTMPNEMRVKASAMACGDALRREWSDYSGPGGVAHLSRGVENRLIAEGVPGSRQTTGEIAN